LIKNESELASVLGNAFASYANRVQNGLTQPYRAFLDGALSVDVTVTLQGDVVTVKAVEAPIVEPFVMFTKCECPLYEPSLEGKPGPDGAICLTPGHPTAMCKPIESPVLEATEDESDANMPELSAEKEIIEKPKRKRKKPN
jgi:hypothetical protein